MIVFLRGYYRESFISFYSQQLLVTGIIIQLEVLSRPHYILNITFDAVS
jgi:hypothetical protein